MMMKTLLAAILGVSSAKTPVVPPVEYLLEMSAADFRTNSPVGSKVDVRNVRLAHIKATDGSNQYLFCGEFRLRQDQNDGTWEKFTTVKTSRYEQWLGPSSDVLCKREDIVFDSFPDLTARLQTQIDSGNSGK